tara:strand:- start:43 stop:654 length:612 start_codon:yes stop_codon:yes gene_type:complete
MCDPVTLAVGGKIAGTTATAGAKILAATSIYSTVASTALSIRGQQQQAKVQARMQAAQSKAENQRYLAEVSAMRMQQAQQQQAVAQQIEDSTRQAREARATARVSAGESGVTGLSVDALISDFTRQEAEFRFATFQQQEMANVNRELQLQDASRQSEQNLISINQPIQRPNYAGAAIDLFGTGADIYRNAQNDLFIQKKLESM